MTIPVITVLPIAPARTDTPAVFNTRADAFLGALYSPFSTQMNASITAINTDVSGIDASVIAAQLAETNAQTAETNAELAETNAEAQVVLATDQVVLATDQVDLATIQAGNAATSASQAATTYDNFDDRYLGDKASDPTLDNDGNPLLTGALYFNTVSNAMKVYTGSAWSAVAPAATSITVSQISDYTGTAVELNYTDGVTSNIQTQLDAKDSLPSQTGNTGKFLTTNGTAAAWDAVDVSSEITGTLPIANGGTGSTSTAYANLTTNVTGTLPVANGGTGATTLTANYALLGDGTSALQMIAPSTSGNVLTSDGTTWASTAPAAGGFSNKVLITSTGSYTIPADIIKIYVVGGGAGSGSAFSGTGGVGGTSSFAYGGFPTINGTGANGGNTSGTYNCAFGGIGQNGDVNIAGGYGQGGAGAYYTGGTLGGVSALGGNNGGGQGTSSQAAIGYGGGAGGTGGNASVAASSGGGGGGMAIKYITGQSGVVATITIGAGGAGGVGGGSNGAAGYQGVVIVEY